MNVIIINTYDILGGAARAVLRLHRGFQKIGVNSFMLVKEKKSSFDKIIQINTVEKDNNQNNIHLLNKIQTHYINKNRTNLSNTLFSLPYPGYDLSNLDLIKNADIINLHWVTRFQSVETIVKLLNLGKPVIWTLHDQWAFTGGCHYSAGCQNFKYDCKNCPLLLEDPFNLPYNVLFNKLRLFHYPNLFIVTPSNWLSKVAKESILFNNHKNYSIPNSVEIDVFNPIPKEKAKKELGIFENTIVLYFGAHTSKEKRKGLYQLMDSIYYCLKNNKFKKLVDRNEIVIIFSGYPNDDLAKLNIAYKSFGFIDTDEKLNLLYSAADITLLPSLEDNLPNIMLESMSCGTPVIAFNCGGMPDLIKNGKTGKLAKPYDTDEFGQHILDLIFNPELRKKMSYNCRELIEAKYKLEEQAKNYLLLFDKCLNESSETKKRSFKTEKKMIVDFDTNFDQNLKPLFNKYSSE